MKKTFLSLVFAAAVSSAAMAQVSFGPKIGLGISNQKNTKVASGSTRSYSSVLTPQIGVVLNAQLGDHFAIRPELLYLQRGSKYENAGTTTTSRVGYIELPVNVAAGIQAGPGKLELFAGPAIGFALGGKYKTEGGGSSETGSIKAKKVPDPYPSGSDAYINPLNVSLNFGIDYKFDNGLLIQVGYNLGLSNLDPHYSNSDLESERSKTVNKANAINIGVAYLFGGKE